MVFSVQGLFFGNFTLWNLISSIFPGRKEGWGKGEESLSFSSYEIDFFLGLLFFNQFVKSDRLLLNPSFCWLRKSSITAYNDIKIYIERDSEARSRPSSFLPSRCTVYFLFHFPFFEKRYSMMMCSYLKLGFSHYLECLIFISRHSTPAHLK